MTTTSSVLFIFLDNGKIDVELTEREDSPGEPEITYRARFARGWNIRTIAEKQLGRHLYTRWRSDRTKCPHCGEN